MEVVLLTNVVAPDRIGGLERYVRELAGGLVQRGMDVTVHAKQVAPELPAEELAADGVHIVRHRVPRRSSALFAVTSPVAVAANGMLAARRSRHAVVHAHYPLPATLLAATQRPYMYTFHAPVYRELLSERAGSYRLPRVAQGAAVETLRRAERAVLRGAAHTIVLSDFMRAQLHQVDARVAGAATRLAGGVDVDHFVPDEGSTSPWPRAAGPRLFCARRLTRRTGVQQLIAAMPQILEALPSAQLVIAGEGLLYGELEALIHRLALSRSVRLIGRATESDLRNWYRSADLVVMPTQELEGFGLAMAEALACGTPVLGTPVGAIPEVLTGLDQRLLTSDASPRALAEGVISLASDRVVLDGLRAMARTHALGFGWQPVLTRHIELYSALSRR